MSTRSGSSAEIGRGLELAGVARVVAFLERLKRRGDRAGANRDWPAQMIRMAHLGETHDHLHDRPVRAVAVDDQDALEAVARGGDTARTP